MQRAFSAGFAGLSLALFFTASVRHHSSIIIAPATMLDNGIKAGTNVQTALFKMNDGSSIPAVGLGVCVGGRVCGCGWVGECARVCV